MKHVLYELGQEVICRICKRRWDFDERPDPDEDCEPVYHDTE